MKGRSTRGTLPWLMLGAGAVLFAKGMRQLRRIDFRNRSVIISGGSRGLGLELARQLAGEGARLSLLARDPKELERAKAELARSGADVLTYECDIRDEEEVSATVDDIVRRRGRIDVLINDAGIVQVAPFENLDPEDYRESMDVHAWGPLRLVSRVVPHMQRQKFGRIVNISSIGGVVAVPHLLAYTMGKFALTGLSDGLRGELAKDGIKVTTVAPGLMRTGAHVNAYFKGQYRKEFAWFSISQANPLLSTTPRHAARQIIQACRFGQPRLIITFPAKALFYLNALFPSLTAMGAGIAGRLLPAPSGTAGHRLHTGWESTSGAAPSLLTRLNDREIPLNNEM